MLITDQPLVDFIFRDNCSACINFKGESLSDSNFPRKNFKWCESDIAELMSAFTTDKIQHFKVRGITYNLNNTQVNQVVEFFLHNGKVIANYYQRGSKNQCLTGNSFSNDKCNSYIDSKQYKDFDLFLEKNISQKEIHLINGFPSIVLFNGEDYKKHMNDPRYPLQGYNLDYKTMSGVLTQERINYSDIKQEIKKYIS